MSDVAMYVQDIMALHTISHRQLREEVVDLDTDTLNWKPGPDTSSIGTLVVHALGAEAEMLRNLLEIPTERDRDSEFAPRIHRREILLQLIDAAEDDWEQFAPRLGTYELRTLIPRPNKPILQSGLFWLVRNYGHLREHLA